MTSRWLPHKYKLKIRPKHGFGYQKKAPKTSQLELYLNHFYKIRTHQEHWQCLVEPSSSCNVETTLEYAQIFLTISCMQFISQCSSLKWCYLLSKESVLMVYTSFSWQKFLLHLPVQGSCTHQIQWCDLRSSYLSVQTAKTECELYFAGSGKWD